MQYNMQQVIFSKELSDQRRHSGRSITRVTYVKSRLLLVVFCRCTGGSTWWKTVFVWLTYVTCRSPSTEYWRSAVGDTQVRDHAVNVTRATSRSPLVPIRLITVGPTWSRSHTHVTFAKCHSLFVKFWWNTAGDTPVKNLINATYVTWRLYKLVSPQVISTLKLVRNLIHVNYVTSHLLLRVTWQNIVVRTWFRSHTRVIYANYCFLMLKLCLSIIRHTQMSNSSHVVSQYQYI